MQSWPPPSSSVRRGEGKKSGYDCTSILKLCISCRALRRNLLHKIAIKPKLCVILPSTIVCFNRKMTIRKCLLLIVGALVSVCMQAQSTLYERYINRYSAMAVDQMQRYGVPASITLAQGLLESAAGTSRLAKEGNNHFGIKVGGSWNGPYMVMADDRPDDKFRVYHSASESFEDHSKFLRNNRRTLRFYVHSWWPAPPRQKP